ncbi:hypothetical protein P7C70_g7515, partial [Phenoliferia sp. Uapishka_3]
MGVISPINSSNTAGVSTTTWFPDTTGTRSNAPGRAAFTLSAEINLNGTVRRALASRRGKKDLLSPTPNVPIANEPHALSGQDFQLHPIVVDGSVKALPGSRAYSGQKAPTGYKYGVGAGTNGSLQWLNGRTPGDLMRRPTGKQRFERKELVDRVTAERRGDGGQFSLKGDRKGGKGGRVDTRNSLQALLDGLEAGGRQ